MSSDNRLLGWYQMAEQSADRLAKSKHVERVCQEHLVLKHFSELVLISPPLGRGVSRLSSVKTN